MIMMILALVSALYGVLILQVGSGTKFWIIWEIIAAFFICWAMLSRSHFFDSHRKLSIAFHSMVLIGIIVLTTLCGMIASEFTAKGTEKLDYIIVLGAQVRENGPSVVLRYRLDTAIEYLEENPETVCIVSGGQGVNEPFTEAEGMANYLIENGIEKERILLENESKNTVQNMQYSSALMDETYSSVGIVTNNFHMFRAMKLAKAQGLKNVCAIAADSNALYLPNNVLRECLGILKDWVMKNI